MIKVKICGITSLEDALYAQDSGADAVGFIFYNQSRRYIQPQLAKKIVQKLDIFTSKVGVFVNSEPHFINQISSEVNLTHIQLHGEETIEEAKSLYLPVIRSINYSQNIQKDISDWNDYTILLDSGSKKERGGTGHTFPWNDVKPHLGNKKFILAGGLSIKNIQEAIKIMHPYAVDVNSGVEKSPGVKDHGLIKEFIRKVKIQ